jgi:predicted RNase H-like HicB family nuclease
MALYDIEIVVEEIDDGGDYRFVATSPDLPNLLVAGDTPEEVIDLAPQVASALIASMKAAGDKFPPTLRPVPRLPFSSRMAITA